jgi:hypothetical protein
LFFKSSQKFFIKNGSGQWRGQCPKNSKHMYVSKPIPKKK